MGCDWNALDREFRESVDVPDLAPDTRDWREQFHAHVARRRRGAHRERRRQGREERHRPCGRRTRSRNGVTLASRRAACRQVLVLPVSAGGPDSDAPLPPCLSGVGVGPHVCHTHGHAEACAWMQPARPGGRERKFE